MFSIDRNKKQFPAKIMQGFARLDDESTKGVFDQIERPLVSDMAIPGRASVGKAQNKASVLQAQKRGSKTFGKSRIG